MIPRLKDNIKLKLVLAFPLGAPIMLVKVIIGVPPVIADKVIKVLLIYSKLKYICLVFYSLLLFL